MKEKTCVCMNVCRCKDYCQLKCCLSEVRRKWNGLENKQQQQQTSEQKKFSSFYSFIIYFASTQDVNIINIS